MDLGIAGKTAAVAGGSAGLGLGCARALAAEGVQVAIGSRSQERVAAAAAEIGAVPLVADVSTIEGAQGFIADATQALGQVDILIANAGGPPPGNFASTDVEAYQGAVSLNMLSTIAMCKAVFDQMKDRGWGRIVAITSLSVRQPMGNLILSNTARAGVTAFLKTMATEVAPHGITVNSLQPGSHLTDRLRSLQGFDPEKAAKAIPAGIIGDADDFGRAAAFLCSDSAKFITGAALPLDGGAYGGLQ